MNGLVRALHDDLTLGVNQFFLEQLNKYKGVFPKGFNLIKLIDQVSEAYGREDYKPGYRSGVILVRIPAEGWKTRVVTLKEGMVLEGSFKSRVPGEAPRKQTGVRFKSYADLPDAEEVEVVLYAHHVLAEKDEPRTGNDWDIITVLVHPTKGGAPMSAGTLMANHFGVSGGTNTNMTPEQFEAALKESYLYWSDKAIAEVEGPGYGIRTNWKRQWLTSTDGEKWSPNESDALRFSTREAASDVLYLHHLHRTCKVWELM